MKVYDNTDTLVSCGCDAIWSFELYQNIEFALNALQTWLWMHCRHDLGPMSRDCPGRVPGMSRACPGIVAGMSRECPGRVPGGPPPTIMTHDPAWRWALSGDAWEVKLDISGGGADSQKTRATPVWPHPRKWEVVFVFSSRKIQIASASQPSKPSVNIWSSLVGELFVICWWYPTNHQLVLCLSIKTITNIICELFDITRKSPNMFVIFGRPPKNHK